MAELYAPANQCEIVTSAGWRVYRISLPYPAELSSPGVSGPVTFGFDVGCHGVPRNIKVLKSSPPGLFDAPARASLQRCYFEQLGDAANTTSGLHVSVTVNFAPPPAVSASKPAVPRTGGF